MEETIISLGHFEINWPLVNVESSGRLFQIFVAFSECLNFNQFQSTKYSQGGAPTHDHEIWFDLVWFEYIQAAAYNGARTVVFMQQSYDECQQNTFSVICCYAICLLKVS